MRLIFCLLIVVFVVLYAEKSWAKKKHEKDPIVWDANENRNEMMHYFNEDIEAVPQSKDRDSKPNKDSRPDFDNDSGNKRPTKRPPKRPPKRPNKKPNKKKPNRVNKPNGVNRPNRVNKPNRGNKKPVRRPRPSRRKSH